MLRVLRDVCAALLHPWRCPNGWGNATSVRTNWRLGSYCRDCCRALTGDVPGFTLVDGSGAFVKGRWGRSPTHLTGIDPVPGFWEERWLADDAARRLGGTVREAKITTGGILT